MPKPKTSKVGKQKRPKRAIKTTSAQAKNTTIIHIGSKPNRRSRPSRAVPAQQPVIIQTTVQPPIYNTPSGRDNPSTLDMRVDNLHSGMAYLQEQMRQDIGKLKAELINAKPVQPILNDQLPVFETPAQDPIWETVPNNESTGGSVNNLREDRFTPLIQRPIRIIGTPTSTPELDIEVGNYTTKNKGGRPKGSKNRPKIQAQPVFEGEVAEAQSAPIEFTSKFQNPFEYVRPPSSAFKVVNRKGEPVPPPLYRTDKYRNYTDEPVLLG